MAQLLKQEKFYFHGDRSRFVVNDDQNVPRGQCCQPVKPFDAFTLHGTRTGSRTGTNGFLHIMQNCSQCTRTRNGTRPISPIPFPVPVPFLPPVQCERAIIPIGQSPKCNTPPLTECSGRSFAR